MGRGLPGGPHRRPRGAGRGRAESGERGDGAGVLRRDRRQPPARQARHRVREAGRCLPAHPRELGAGHGPAAAGGAVGHRRQDREEAGGRRHHQRLPAGRHRYRRAGATIRSHHGPVVPGAGAGRRRHRRVRRPVRAAVAQPRGHLPAEHHRPPRAREAVGRAGRAGRCGRRGEGRPAARVGVKVRFAPFFTHTRSVTLPAPTEDIGEITAAALGLLDKFETGRPVRLLGVRAEFDRAR